MSSPGRNMYVFRDGRMDSPTATLIDSLAATLQQLSGLSSFSDLSARELLIDGLLRAGELECGLTDAGSAEVPRLARLTDWLARLLAGGACSRPLSEETLRLLPRHAPATLSLSPPEGFAYYGLHPMDLADLADRIEIPSGHAAVIGIRSIGVTLGAVVLAAMQRRGVQAERITVRPVGHPYARQTSFDGDQLRWVGIQRARQAEFLVVDEGPGMSGSSFLSVGEALLGAGVPRDRLHLLGSRYPDPATLCARDAARRWNEFRFAACAPASRLPADAALYLGGGYWRHELLGPDPKLWPASWSQMERMKFLSPDRRTLYKFEGFGRHGEELRRRARVLADAGWGASPGNPEAGFTSYQLLTGTILRSQQVDRELLAGLARYCAFRREAFAFPPDGSGSLQTMLSFNTSQEFGLELDGQLDQLAVESPVLADARMLPHEWIRTPEGRLMKCDGNSHGDDHFFPAPGIDICWDLAGAIVEWNLDEPSSDYFLQVYEKASGEDPRRRLPAYRLAYSVFRLAYCRMAAEAMQASEEEPRLLSAYSYYRSHAAAHLPKCPTKSLSPGATIVNQPLPQSV